VRGVTCAATDFWLEKCADALPQVATHIRARSSRSQFIPVEAAARGL
jgi:hypothetical protein